MKKNNLLENVLPILLILAVIFLLTNVALIQVRAGKWKEAQEIVKEKLRPAELQLITLTADNCNVCSEVTDGVEQLKSLNVNITEEKIVEGSSALGKELIEKYGVTKLSTFIVSGELNKSEQLSSFFESNGVLQDDRFVYTSGKAPYFDINLNQPAGLVTVFTLKDLSCPECTDLSSIPEALKEQGVLLQTNKEIDFRGTEGKNLMAQYDIKKIPALLISKEIELYPEVYQQLLEIDASQKQGYYAIHAIAPPYRDVETDKIVGLVDLVLLKDDTCAACYDVKINEQILQNFGVAFKTKKTLDINSPEGQALKEKYKITKLPIIIVSPDAEAYPALVQAWKSVGRVEENGWFVMRRPELLGVYKNLETNEVVIPQQGATAQGR